MNPSVTTKSMPCEKCFGVVNTTYITSSDFAVQYFIPISSVLKMYIRYKSITWSGWIVLDNTGDILNLTTTAKDSLVSALNELNEFANKYKGVLIEAQTVSYGIYQVNGKKTFIHDGVTYTLPGNPYGILRIQSVGKGFEFISFTQTTTIYYIYNGYAEAWFSVNLPKVNG